MATTDEHIIDKFREMIMRRYDYETLRQEPNFPSAITAPIIEEIKNYFLNTIYPAPEERRRLELAFRDLAGYVRAPKKIWGLFGDMAWALFRFGRHFMQALGAGIDALNSFMGAKRFESEMAEIANKNNIFPPISDEAFEQALFLLPREETEKFILDIRNLFAAMIKTELLKKTIDILQHVIETMESKPKTFSKEDVEGIKLGKELLTRGFAIFSKYDDSTKKSIVEFIYQNEMQFIDAIYKKRLNQV